MDLLERIAQAKEEAEASSDKLDKIVALVKEGAAIQETIESLTEALKVNVGRFNRIKQVELVNLMKEANMGKYESEDGKIKTKLDNYVSGSLPKDEHDKEEALKVLEEAGGAALIKTDVAVRFPKNMHNAAKDFFVKVQELLKEYDPSDEIDFEPEFKEGVHAASLQAFAREKIRKGEELNYEALGLTVGQHVKFEFYEEDEKGKLKKKKAKATEDV
jgi:hypothetical protein